MGEANILQALMALEYWEALEYSEALTIVKTLLLALGNDLLYLLVSSPKKY